MNGIRFPTETEKSVVRRYLDEGKSHHEISLLTEISIAVIHMWVYHHMVWMWWYSHGMNVMIPTWYECDDTHMVWMWWYPHGMNLATLDKMNISKTVFWKLW